MVMLLAGLSQKSSGNNLPFQAWTLMQAMMGSALDAVKLSVGLHH